MDRAQESEVKNAAALILATAIRKRNISRVAADRVAGHMRAAMERSSEQPPMGIADVFRGILAAVRASSGRSSRVGAKRSRKASKAV